MCRETLPYPLKGIIKLALGRNRPKQVNNQFKSPLEAREGLLCSNPTFTFVNKIKWRGSALTCLPAIRGADAWESQTAPLALLVITSDFISQIRNRPKQVNNQSELVIKVT
eukprot:sb/3477127/